MSELIGLRYLRLTFYIHRDIQAQTLRSEGQSPYPGLRWSPTKTKIWKSLCAQELHPVPLSLPEMPQPNLLRLHNWNKGVFQIANGSRAWTSLCCSISRSFWRFSWLFPFKCVRRPRDIMQRTYILSHVLHHWLACVTWIFLLPNVIQSYTDTLNLQVSLHMGHKAFKHLLSFVILVFEFRETN